MLKRIVFILCFIISPAFAGVYEDSLKQNDNVFLYLYTQDCRTCRKFDSFYNDLKNSINNYGFVKVNADTAYGNYLLRKFKGRYVPYIILTNAKSNKSVQVDHSCAMDEICMVRAMKSFNDNNN